MDLAIPFVNLLGYLGTTTKMCPCLFPGFFFCWFLGLNIAVWDRKTGVEFFLKACDLESSQPTQHFRGHLCHLGSNQVGRSSHKLYMYVHMYMCIYNSRARSVVDNCPSYTLPADHFSSHAEIWGSPSSSWMVCVLARLTRRRRLVWFERTQMPDDRRTHYATHLQVELPNTYGLCQLPPLNIFSWTC